MKRSVSVDLGVCIYAAGAIALGVAGLISGDFATNWQHVVPGVPFRHALALLAAVWELGGGVLLTMRRTRLYGAAMLTAIYCVFVLLWAPPIIQAPSVYDSWGNFFEELSLVIAGVVLCMQSAPGTTGWPGRAAQCARVYGICAISFGVDHFVYLKGVAGFVPKWIPPGQMFWAVATAVCFLLAAGALLTGIMAGLAARLLAVMILCFEVLLWMPALRAAPRLHFNWSANAINVAMIGAAWVVADVLSSPRDADA